MDGVATRFFHLTEVRVKSTNRISGRSAASIKIEVDNECYKSERLNGSDIIAWECNLYISAQAKMIITLREEVQLLVFPKRVKVTATVDCAEVDDGEELTVTTPNRNTSFCLSFRTPLHLKQVVLLLGEGISSALESKVIFLGKIDKVSSFIQGVIDIGSALSGLNPISTAVYNIVNMVFQKFRLQQKCHKQALDLLDSVVAKLPFADIIPEKMQSEEVRNALDTMLEIVRGIFVFLDNYASAPAREDFIVSRISDIIDLQLKLRDATDNFNTCVSAVQYRMVHAGRSHQETEALGMLRPILEAQYNHHHACLEGTRKEVLDVIMNWAKSSTILETLFWLFGLAGSGKSAIASTICNLLRDENLLAGSFHCKRDIPEQRKAGNILPSLAYNLAIVHKSYRQQVLRVLESEPAIASADISLQLRMLFMEPIARLNEMEIFDKVSPYIFVIDALDECSDPRMAEHLAQLAGACDWLKMFITSRPLPEIHRKFDPPKCPHSKLVDLTTISAEDDIRQYTKHSLEELANDQGLDDRWISEEFIEQLSKKASGLFIWTSTVMKFVEARYDKEAAFNMILSGSVGLDSLYLNIIRGSRGGSNADNLNLLREVLGMIYTTAKNRPVTFDALHEFMVTAEDGSKLSKATLRAVMNDLKALLYEDASKGDIIRVCHPSLLDFISDKDRSLELWTDPGSLDRRMAIKCLTTMNEGLKFNICHLESSRVKNDDVVDLLQRIKKYIPETTQYSCSYWIDHLVIIDHAESQLIKSIFGGPKILYWIEVLSLIRDLRNCVPKLQYLLKFTLDDNEITTAVTDIYRFMTSFYEAISASTPHIYISALTWLPEESYLAKHLYPFFENQPLIRFGRERRWQSSLWVKGVGGPANVVTFSPDGTRVAAASGGGMIYIWDTKTGEETGLLLHTSSVFCLSWSPDGNRIASGSGSNVYLWDAETYTVIGEPWEGHAAADIVTAIAHSPNNKLIVSSGSDTELTIWYADGRRAREPLRGHSQIVNVVVFSPDSKVIASGSSDTTIRLWDVDSGDELQCIQHTSWVACLVYSHDGSFLAATSNDYAIDIWNVKTGMKHKNSLVGHHSVVRGVAFSPDDTMIVSGSDDLTVRFWDLNSGLQRGQPYRGHQHWILSIAFSPDGNYVASGANDNTVRLWDVHAATSAERGTKRYKGASSRRGLDILSDGSRIVSGTEDGTIHIWDATTFMLLKILEGHTACINSLKSSRDGKFIFSSSDDRSIRVWNAETGSQLRHISSDTFRKVEALALSPDGKQLASAAGEGKIRVWSTDTWEPLGEAILNHDQHIYVLCYSRDGTLLASGGVDKLINIWKTEDMELLRKPLEGHQGTIFAAVFSAKADKLVSGGDDCTIRVWCVGTREQLLHINWHTQWVTCIDLSPDGTHFVAASADTSLSVWDLEIGECLNTLRGHTSWISSVIYSSDGKSIVSASDDSTLRVWDAEAPKQIKFVPELDLFLTYHSIHDGWIRNRMDELIIWIPPDQRNGLRDVCRRCIPEDAAGHPVLLDWEKLTVDGRWTEIMKEDP